MKRYLITGILALAALSLTGCDATKQSPAAVTQQKSPAKAGADRDAHGCIPSAGYRWCAKTQKCERPWELAKEKNFEKSEKAFENFCNN